MMTIRAALTVALALSLLAAPPAASAQPAQFRVSWMSPTRAADGSPFLDELRAGLKELGYVEGRNLVLESHWGEDSAERVEKLVVKLGPEPLKNVGVDPDGDSRLARRATKDPVSKVGH